MVHKPRNRDQARRQGPGSRVRVPIRCSAGGRSPGQALCPAVPRFPRQELMLTVCLETGAALVNTGRQRGAGVGNRWNS